MFRSFLPALTFLAVTLTAPIASADTMLASWYGPGFHGNLMANGRPFNQNDPTVVANKTLPFCTQIKVQGPTGKTKTLIVKDRGPYHGDRELDVSKAAAQELGFIGAGEAELKVLKVTLPAKKHRYGKPCERYLG